MSYPSWVIIILEYTLSPLVVEEECARPPQFAFSVNIAVSRRYSWNLLMGSWRRTEGVTCGTEPTFILFLQSLDSVSLFWSSSIWLVKMNSFFCKSLSWLSKSIAHEKAASSFVWHLDHRTNLFPCRSTGITWDWRWLNHNWQIYRITWDAASKSKVCERTN